MAQQCFRSLGTKFPTSPLCQTIGGSGIIFKPTIMISSSEYTNFKTVSRQQTPALTVDDQIAILGSLRSFGSLYHYPLLLNSTYGGKPVDFILNRRPEDMHIVKSSESSTVTLASGATGDKLSPKRDDPVSDKPLPDQLNRVHDVLKTSLLKLFTTPMDYSVYNPNIVFVDNIRNKTTQGLLKYVQQVALLRVVGHLKFAFVKFEILNSNVSVEDGRITIRWRINGISGMRVMLRFWKYRLWNWKEMITSQEQWYDGISHFDVGADGLIFRHTVDKLMEDKSPQEIEMKQNKAALVAKLGILASLFPQPTSLAFSTKLVDSPQQYGIDNQGLQPI